MAIISCFFPGNYCLFSFFSPPPKQNGNNFLLDCKNFIGNYCLFSFFSPPPRCNGNNFLLNCKNFIGNYCLFSAAGRSPLPKTLYTQQSILYQNRQCPVPVRSADITANGFHAFEHLRMRMAVAIVTAGGDQCEFRRERFQECRF